MAKRTIPNLHVEAQVLHVHVRLLTMHAGVPSFVTSFSVVGLSILFSMNVLHSVAPISWKYR